MKLNSILWKDLGPCILHIVEHLGDELDFGLFSRRICSGHRRGARSNSRLNAKVAEKVTSRDEAQSENDDRSPYTESTAHSATRSTVLQIAAAPAWIKTHETPPQLVVPIRSGP